CRPQYAHAWHAKSYFTSLRLDPLPNPSSERLLNALLGEDARLAGLRRLLIDQTGGTPVFIEGSGRALAEAGALTGSPGAYHAAGTIHDLEIPSTVHAVLAARIDRLPLEAKGLLQVAAVVGKDVPLELLQPLARLAPEALHEALNHLERAE